MRASPLSNFPENLTDDFLAIFIGVVGTIVIAAVVFIGQDDLPSIALGAIIGSVGTVLAGFIPRKGTPPQE